MPYSFKGGVHPSAFKRATRDKPVEDMPPPERIILPMQMHIGTPCEPLVRVGEQVKLGQMIGEAKGAVSAPVHASVSGKVQAIEPHTHVSGRNVLSVFIENDGLDTPHEDMRPRGSVESLSPEELLATVLEAGIVGMGGAAFPTHVKVSSVLGKAEKLIINASECEPYITSDHRLMLEAPEELVGGVRILMKMLGLSEAVIAVESDKRDAAEMVRRTLPRKRSNIKVVTLPKRYPQGSEKQLIKAVSGREVPPGQLPLSVGCAVFNTETTAAIHRAVTTGLPLIRRIVTVTGSAVSNPKNLMVRIGTTLKAVFDATGGFRETPNKVIVGGPMMGTAQHDLDTVVVKGVNALLAFSRKEDARVDNPICIRCGRCVSVCPMNLLPVYMYMHEQKGNISELDKLRIRDCLECGCCSYSCPGRLYLVQSFRTGKQKINDKNENLKAGGVADGK
ncbi:MAG: electron transport complex subunit RsxC [Oscillospiraceae bacterium]|nr:electron transport complex subunit RsxC [Oscillospiraceae bacterium]